MRRGRHAEEAPREHAPVGAGTPARPSSWLRMALALAAYELRLVLRRGEGLLITFVIPAGVLLVFSAFDTSGGTAAGEPAVEPAAARARSPLAIIAASLVSLAISTGFERQYGVIKRLGGSPGGLVGGGRREDRAVVIVELVQLVLLVGHRARRPGLGAGPRRVAAARGRRGSCSAPSRSRASGC